MEVSEGDLQELGSRVQDHWEGEEDGVWSGHEGEEEEEEGEQPVWQKAWNAQRQQEMEHQQEVEGAAADEADGWDGLEDDIWDEEGDAGGRHSSSVQGTAASFASDHRVDEHGTGDEYGDDNSDYYEGDYGEEREEVEDLGPRPSKRKLLQAKMETCVKGTYLSTTKDLTAVPAPLGSPKITLGAQKFDGLGVNITDVVPMCPTLAIGRTHMIHAINSVLRVYRVNPSTGNVTSLFKTVTLPDFFALVESPCYNGVNFPAAAYDKKIGRYLLTAVCAGPNTILLAVSVGDTAEGKWILYSLPGEPRGSRLTCGTTVNTNPAYTQLNYNNDGVYITYYQDCDSSWFDNSGAVLYALPKWAVYKGATYFWFPVFTAFEVLLGIGDTNDSGWFTGGFRQLQPVMPQRAADVLYEVAYFVGEVSTGGGGDEGKDV
jgi:hypothetical protein